MEEGGGPAVVAVLSAGFVDSSVGFNAVKENMVYK